MTTTSFAPTPTAPFQFQAVLDGAEYVVITTWNTYGQRWYINIYDQNGTRVLTKARVSSTADYSISMTGGYFNSTLTYNDALQQYEVLP